MSLEEIFLNLSSEEFQQASAWLANLRDVENPRIQDALRLINRTDFTLTGTSPRFAVIAAGSSIGSKAYNDIDLFLIAEKDEPRLIESSLYGVNMDIRRQLRGLPEFVYYFEYGTMTQEDDLPDKSEMLAEGLGAPVTISLFFKLNGFQMRRPDHMDDLLDPGQPMTAEQLIKYNREQSSKFLVLSKQYSPSG